MKHTVIAAAMTAALLFAAQAYADDAPRPLMPGSDAEMKQIFDADQGDRTTISMKPGTADRDAQRREATRKLLADGRLHTGQDYTEAAYVFQHGHGDDFLLAHTLAVIATKKGDPEGPKIAAMTLDRYLQSHGAKQIYGTQYSWSSETGQSTMDPYDRDLISDALRAELGVPDQAQQQVNLEKYRAAPKPETGAGMIGAAQPGAAAAKPGSTTIKCDSHGIDHVFLHDTWKVEACGDKGVIAFEDTPTGRAILFVIMPDGKVHVSRIGTAGKPEEVAAATAAFEAMTPAEVADLAAKARAGG